MPDVRPWLFGSLVSIVPLRIGGGTRLKIYEAMAAGAPVVSTAIGAEGLDVAHGENIFLADSPRDFADRCLALLESAASANACPPPRGTWSPRNIPGMLWRAAWNSYCSNRS